MSKLEEWNSILFQPLAAVAQRVHHGTAWREDFEAEERAQGQRLVRWAAYLRDEEDGPMDDCRQQVR